MKRRGNVCMMILFGAAILAGCLLLPNMLLKHQKNQALQDQSVVPVEEVHPYGEEYIPVRDALQQTLQVMNQNDLSKEKWQENQGLQEIIPAGYEKLKNFMNLWNENYESVLEADHVSVDDIYVCASHEGTFDLAFLPYLVQKDETIKYVNEVYFLPQYGIPVSGKIIMSKELFQETADGSVNQQIWDNLLQAYTQVIGIPFQEEQQTDSIADDMRKNEDTDMMGNQNDSDIESSDGVLNMENQTYAAKSMDDVFGITAIMYDVSEDKIGIVFSLSES